MYKFHFVNKPIFSTTYKLNQLIIAVLLLSSCGKLPPILSNNTDSENRKTEIRSGNTPESETAVLPGFPNSENEITKIVVKTKADVARLFDEIAAQKSNATFENTFKKLDQA